MNFSPQGNREFGYAPSASSIVADESSRAFMAKVYRWMFAGLALTGGTAFYVAQSQQLMSLVMSMFMPLIIGELLLVMALSFLASRVNGVIAAIMFLGYALLNGLTFSAIFLAYRLGSVGMAFAITAGTFGAMSIYANVTKKDLSGWGTFLFMGLVGILIAGIVNIFVQSEMLMFVKSCAGVLVFSGLAAYDTQKLKQMHAASGYSTSGSLPVVGALTLYLDFINLFLSILRLMGRRR